MKMCSAERLDYQKDRNSKGCDAALPWLGIVLRSSLHQQIIGPCSLNFRIVMNLPFSCPGVKTIHCLFPYRPIESEPPFRPPLRWRSLS
jgi:hypothetical protein